MMRLDFWSHVTALLGLSVRRTGTFVGRTKTRDAAPKRSTSPQQMMITTLRERGLEPKDGDFRILTADELRAAYPQLVPKELAGFPIPYFDVKGAPTGFCRFPYTEEQKPSGWDKLTGRKLEEVRYCQPTGERPRVYFPKHFNWQGFFSKPASQRRLIITEGEFKAVAAVKAGFPCIALGGVNCSHTAATKDQPAALLSDLARLPWPGMSVALCYDSDAVTNQEVLDAEDKLARELERRGARVNVIRLPQLERGSKTGLDDFLVLAGHREFAALPWNRWYPVDTPQLAAHDRQEFLTTEYPEREEILASKHGVLLCHPSIVEIHAYRGVGKTHLALTMAGALTEKDRSWLRWSSKRALRVLYVEGEQPAADLQQQVKHHTAPNENFHIMVREDQTNSCFPRIVTTDGQRALERFIEEYKIEVLFLDSLSTLANIAMNDEENQIALTEWFMRLRAMRVTVVYLQHDGKTGQQRGHSKHEDLIDLGIHLTWAEGYRGVDGLRCHFSIDKARRPVLDGQDMRIAWGTTPTSAEPVWTYEYRTQNQEKADAVANEIRKALFADRHISERKVIKLLQDKNLGMKKEKLAAIYKEVRQEAIASGLLRPNADSEQPDASEGTTKRAKF